ncbi:MAG: DoxX family protein [Gammaproteobacteria bacterium]|nr:DoxX family protein [Gammaproteobacteria bacterium]
MEKVTQLVARLFLGHIFLLAGLGKIADYAATQAYMDSVGVPGMLLPFVILLEAGAGLAVIVGWQTKCMAGALAIFTLVAAALFHNDFADKMQMIMFMKNLSITGGLLLVVVHGAGAFSLDKR